MITTALSVHQLAVVRGGVSILNDVSFDIRAGEVVLVTGDNGAGKTTLVKAILGLVPIAAGRITVFDTIVGSSEWRRKRATVGYVNQESISVEFPISAVEVVEIGMAMHSTSRRIRRPLAVAAMERTGTQDLANRDYRVLSGGEKQRVSIARCLAQNAQALLLDEPGAFLDPRGRREVLDTVEMLGDGGVSVLLVSHQESAPDNSTWRRLQLHRGTVTASPMMENP